MCSHGGGAIGHANKGPPEETQHNSASGVSDPACHGWSGIANGCTFCVKKLDANAVLPVRGSAFAAGWDVHANWSGAVPPGQQKVVPTGLAFSMPQGCYGRLASRSGLASKKNVHVGGGVIDPDYRGEVQVILVNLGPTPFEVRPGDRIAQLVLERFVRSEYVQVEDLGDTERGQSGLGSTGLTEIPAKAASCVGDVEAVPRRPKGTHSGNPVVSHEEQQGSSRPEDTSRNGGGGDIAGGDSCAVGFSRRIIVWRHGRAWVLFRGEQQKGCGRYGRCGRSFQGYG